MADEADRRCRVRRTAVATAAVLLLLLAACGEDAHEPASPTRPTASASPSASFDGNAEAICTKMQADGDKLVGSGTPSDADVQRVVDTWRAAIDELGALRPPPGRATEFRKMLVAYRRTLDAMEAMIESEDESVLAAVAGMSVFGHRAARAARRAALERCILFPEITQPEPDPEPIRKATLALLPGRATIVRPAEPGCAAEGSCRVEFRGSGPLASRVRGARRLLAAKGWTHLRDGRTPGTGSAWVMANRKDYAATIELVSDPLPAHCETGSITWGCVDSVWVHRVEVPEVFLTDD